MLITFLNEPRLVLYRVKRFQVLLYNIDNLTVDSDSISSSLLWSSRDVSETCGSLLFCSCLCILKCTPRGCFYIAPEGVCKYAYQRTGGVTLSKRSWVMFFHHHTLTSVICLHTIRSIWPIDRILSGATTPGYSGPMKGYFTFCKCTKLEPCYQMV